MLYVNGKELDIYQNGWYPNLLNPSECIAVTSENGSDIGMNTIGQYTYVKSGYIPTKKGVTYRWNTSDKYVLKVYVYDVSKNLTNSITEGNGYSNISSYTATSDGYIMLYIRLGTTTEAPIDIVSRYGVYEEDFARMEHFFAYGEKAEPFTSINWLKGKTIAVIGDSISTWEGHNDAEIVVSEEDVGTTLSAYQTQYDGALSIGGVSFPSVNNLTKITFTPNASDIGKSIGNSLTHAPSTRRPWWYWLAKKHGMKVNNVSWSGSSISTHDGRLDYSHHESQIVKCGTRIKGSMDRIAPDYIFIARGCNDCTADHTPYATINAVFDKNYTTPTNDNKDLMLGLAITISKLREAYPTSKIIVCTMTPYYRSPDDMVFPMQNGIATEQEYNDAIRKTAEFYSCPICDFDKAFSHLNGGAIGAIGTGSDQTHPSNYGHWLMFFRAEKALEANL